MFATLEGFSIFFFVCLAGIVLAIWNEEKLINFVERREGNVKRKQSKSNHTTNR
jgi:hypothetical protein